MESERTPLRNENLPHYVFLTNQSRQRKNKIRRFQCCICATLLAIFIATLVITISYSVNDNNQDDSNKTTPNSSALNTLLLLSWPLQDQNYSEWEEPLPTPEEVASALETGQKNFLLRESYEDKLPVMLTDSPSFRHQISTKTVPRARELSKSGAIMNVATYELYQRRKNKSGKRRGPIGRWRPNDIKLLPEEVCERQAKNPCQPSPYRSSNGTCNNLIHPRSWGVAMKPFRRILLPDYSDGITAPRKASDGSSLPSAREISVTVHRPYYKDDPNFTVMLAVWGQFIDHDMTATALSQAKDGKPISCCFAQLQSGIKEHQECFVVPIGAPDPFYHQYNVTCMEFVRSAPSPLCSFGPREQMNQASSYLDASVVYGANDQVMDQLRTKLNGELKVLIGPTGQELLPVSTDINDGCNREEEYKKGRYCFLSGDPRSNENLHLTSLHLLFARLHNQITRELANLNPEWTDEKLFQETRKIVAAQIQHITYNEFLPVVLHPDVMHQLNISLQSKGYFKGYNSSVEATIANEFAASAFRFGHSLLPGLMRKIANDTTSAEYIELHKMLFNPFQLFDPNFLEQIIKGAFDTPVKKVDPYFNEELTEHLFERRKPDIGKHQGPCGLDLVSLNIQRGRDHGLPGYPNWREHCGLSRPKSFDDLEGDFDPDTLDRIRKIYKSVDDIDMYTGALAEIPIEGGLVGPTVTCILADQFYRLKHGDRFWYETGEKPQAFTLEQLQEIRKITLARIICDTSEIDEAQPYVMRKPGENNERKPCDQLPKINLNKWKEGKNNSTMVENVVKMFTGLSRVEILKGTGEAQGNLNHSIA